jgi:acetyl esterase/lipase
LRSLSPGAGAEAISLGGVPAIRVSPPRRARGALCVLHGGGYVFGSAGAYRHFAARLAKRVGALAYVVDYRLAPEHPFPAASDDALAAYRALLDLHPPGSIAFVGDSAGGGLAVVTLHRARDAGLPLPACSVLCCPWLDLTGSGESMRSNAGTELLIPPPVPERMARWYGGAHDLADPRLSPLFGHHGGLSPLLVQVSSAEVLRSDAERFAARATSAGAEVTLEIQRGMWHVWQILDPLVRESRAAAASAARFLAAHLDR